MACWLIELDGNKFELQELSYWFPNGDAYAFEENGRVYLTGDHFNKYQKAAEVYEAALQTVTQMVAVLSLLKQNIACPGLGVIYSDQGNGVRDCFVIVPRAATMLCRAVRPRIVINGREQDNPSPTKAQILLRASQTNDHLQAAISLWGDPDVTWPRLYRILEDIERYLGKQVDRAQFCSDKERERFTRSANTAEVSGKDARHAHGKFQPPKDPMSIEMAKQFIADLLGKAIAKASSENFSNPTAP